MPTHLVYTYSPEKNIVLVNGVPMVGFGEDNAIEISPMADMSTSKTGIDGDVSRSTGTDRRAEVVIRLMQTSPSNDVLNAMVGVDLITGGRLISITVQNLLMRDLFVAPQAWLSRRPVLTYAREAGEREWTFQCLPSLWNFGGASQAGF